MTEEQPQRQLARRDSFPLRAFSRWGRFRTVELVLQPSWRIVVFVVMVAGSGVLLGGKAVRAAFVLMLGESLDPGTLRQAIALEPANPELHHRLGMVLCDHLGEADRTDGMKHLRRATELDAYAAAYWADLAAAREMAGDMPGAAQAVEHAVKLSPMTPQLHWVAANTLLRAGQIEAAEAQFRRLLELDPSYGPAVFHVCLGSLGDSRLIEEKVLPPGNDPRLRLAYVNFLISNDLPDQARQVWVHTAKLGTPFPFSLAMPYIERLRELGRIEEAHAAWRDMQKLGVISAPAAGDEDNLVFNGDFEQTPLDTGFDWRARPSPFIAMDFSDPSAYAGKRCLRIDFTVSRNEEYTPLFQFVPVAANREYLLTALVRSQDITSDSGLRLQVVDAIHPSDTNAASETTVGTSPWHPISLKFCTDTEAKLVQVALTRSRARTFPTEITGSFWLDAVVLKPLESSGRSGCTAADR